MWSFINICFYWSSWNLDNASATRNVLAKSFTASLIELNSLITDKIRFRTSPPMWTSRTRSCKWDRKFKSIRQFVVFLYSKIWFDQKLFADLLDFNWITSVLVKWKNSGSVTALSLKMDKTVESLLSGQKRRNFYALRPIIWPLAVDLVVTLKDLHLNFQEIVQIDTLKIWSQTEQIGTICTVQQQKEHLWGDRTFHLSFNLKVSKSLGIAWTALSTLLEFRVENFKSKISFLNPKLWSEILWRTSVF